MTPSVNPTVLTNTILILALISFLLTKGDMMFPIKWIMDSTKNWKNLIINFKD